MPDAFGNALGQALAPNGAGQQTEKALQAREEARDQALWNWTSDDSGRPQVFGGLSQSYVEGRVFADTSNDMRTTMPVSDFALRFGELSGGMGQQNHGFYPVFSGNEVVAYSDFVNQTQSDENLMTVAERSARTLQPDSQSLSITTSRQRTIDDGGDNTWTHKEYIEYVQSRQAAGIASEPEIRQAQRLLYDYGYRLGSLGDGASTVGGITGIFNRETGRSMSEFLRNETNDPIDHAFRHQVYSGIRETSDNGRTTTIRIENENGPRELTLNWAGGRGETHFANRAMMAGVSSDEALRKTDWFVLKQVINAGFATPDVESITINGAWRPPSNKVMSEHPGGNSLDILRLNNQKINRSEGAEPKLVADFTNNLRLQPGAWSLYQPWRLWGGNTGAPIWATGVPNTSRNPLQVLHLDHLHYQARR